MIEEGRNGYLFSTEEEAAAGLRKVEGDWPNLSRVARELAEARYDISKLSRELLGHYQEAAREA
jgi:hypothetical protein